MLKIDTIDDVLPFIADKKEFRVSEGAFGTKIIAADYTDSHSYDSPAALECRGITFDCNGKILSRPLHKFFNVGEKSHTQHDIVLARAAKGEVVSVREKLDGSMIHTCVIEGKVRAKSKKSFTSDVALKAQTLIDSDAHLTAFCLTCSDYGLTPIFEFTHPEHMIVVRHEAPTLKLLHVRENVSGDYLPMDKIFGKFEIVPYLPIDVETALNSLETMRDMEGYVVQFTDGDMVKMKCPWYLRLHGIITFLRESDIVLAVLDKTIDDVRAALLEGGKDISRVDELEHQVMCEICTLHEDVEHVFAQDRHLDVKSFAIKHNRHRLFPLLIALYKGRDVDYTTFYKKHMMNNRFGGML